MTLHTALPLILIFVTVGVFVGLMNVLKMKIGPYLGRKIQLRRDRQKRDE